MIDGLQNCNSWTLARPKVMLSNDSYSKPKAMLHTNTYWYVG